MRNCALVRTALSVVKTRLINEIPDLYYYSKRGEKEASACLNRERARAETRGQALEFDVIAYSMGNEAVIRFAELIAGGGSSIHRVVSVDPVGRGLKW